MKSTGLTAAFALVCLWAAPQAHAQVIDPFDAAQAVAILQAEGYRATIEERDPGAGPRIASSTGGKSFSLSFERCNEAGAECDLLLIETGWDLPDDDGVTVEEINTWNRGSLGKAFLDKEGDPWLSMELPVLGGVVRGNFVEALAIWEDLLEHFQNQVGID